MSLKSQLMVRMVLGAILMPAMLFVPAGSVRFWQGWAYLAVYLVPIFLIMSYLLKRDPQLLERRMHLKEKLSAQKVIRVAMPLIFCAGFVVSAFDYRFGWSRAFPEPVPLWLTLLSLALVLSGVLLVFWVMRVNSFAATTVEVEAGQQVVSSGPYSVVRHPMYSGIIVMSLATPLALGSWIALPVSALLVPVLVIRLLNEERLLRRELPGYSEYCNRKRFRLVPLVW
jgi:protein-S-isoprenylcysteine O-methyltransferase Ste14